MPHGVHLRGVRDFFTHLAVNRQVSASTQNQAFSALLFLCREVLGLPLDDVSSGVKAKRGPRLPVVLSMPETASLLAAMSGTARLMATLIYGAGSLGAVPPEVWPGDRRVGWIGRLRPRRGLELANARVDIRCAKGGDIRPGGTAGWGGRIG